MTSTLGKTKGFTWLTIVAQELHLSNSSHQYFSSLLLVEILYLRFWTYKRALGGMYGVKMHKSLKLLLKVRNQIKWKEMIVIWLKNMYVLLMIQIIAFIRTTLTDCQSFRLQCRVKTNGESFPWQDALCSFIVYVQRTVLVGQIPSPVDRRWKYSKDNSFAVD